jgi:1-acyl-sn-glycerol-3-phosphate acyltransferase
LSGRADQFELLRQRRFGPFFVTQFLGAFNDNLFKNALVILFVFQGAEWSAVSANTLVNLAGGLFILPFFLFSAIAGQFAEKYEKARLIRSIKLLEIGIMVCAAVGFFRQSLVILLGVLFLMGLQSTLFGPVKYSIMPQVLREQELIGGNGLVEMGTFLAILLGTILGGVLIGLGPHGTVLVSTAVLCVAVLGWVVSRSIPLVVAPAPELAIRWNPVRETWRVMRFATENRTVFLSILGISWFWFYGATLLAQLPSFTSGVLGGNEQVVTLILAIFSVGIGVGSLLCEKMSAGKIEIGLVPFGSIGLTLFALDLVLAVPDQSGHELVGALAFLAGPGNWRIVLDLLLIGMFGGFFIVPLYALVQHRSEANHRSRIIAANNIINALFMVGSAMFAIAFLESGASIPQLILVLAVLNTAVGVYVFGLVPEFLLRFFAWILIRSLYRLSATGLEHIPERGAAVLVCNHVSYADPLVLAAACRRPIRFVVDRAMLRIPVVGFILRAAGAIPMASVVQDRSLLKRAAQEIAEALGNGELVCLFPEGGMTHDGQVGPFRRGVEAIVRRTPVPVVPVRLQRLWGGWFSRAGGAPMQGWPRRFRAGVSLLCGEPVAPARVDARSLRDRVTALGVEAR